jgi:hypothetical protein
MKTKYKLLYTLKNKNGFYSKEFKNKIEVKEFISKMKTKIYWASGTF